MILSLLVGILSNTTALDEIERQSIINEMNAHKALDLKRLGGAVQGAGSYLGGKYSDFLSWLGNKTINTPVWISQSVGGPHQTLYDYITQHPTYTGAQQAFSPLLENWTFKDYITPVFKKAGPIAAGTVALNALSEGIYTYGIDKLYRGKINALKGIIKSNIKTYATLMDFLNSTQAEPIPTIYKIRAYIEALSELTSISGNNQEINFYIGKAIDIYNNANFWFLRYFSPLQPLKTIQYWNDLRIGNDTISQLNKAITVADLNEKRNIAVLAMNQLANDIARSIIAALLYQTNVPDSFLF